MNKLLELVRLINRNKVKTIEVIGSLPPRKTMVQEFYEKISSGEIESDEAAAAYFYQSKPEDRNYKELKRRLTERLYNTSFFIDLNQAKYDAMRKAYYNSWRELAVAKILIGKGAYNNYVPLFKKILKIFIFFSIPFMPLHDLFLIYKKDILQASDYEKKTMASWGFGQPWATLDSQGFLL